MIDVKTLILHAKWTKDFTTVKILTNSQTKEWDQYTIEHEPVSSFDLMERAANAIAEAIACRRDRLTPITVFAGPGNNGGDALAVARLLSEKGYQIEAFLFNPTDSLSEDCAANRDLLQMCEGVKFTEVTSAFKPPVLQKENLVIDGLFGSGLSKPLQGGYAKVVGLINNSPSYVVSIDIPSGMSCNGEFYRKGQSIVRADLTLTIQHPKLSFFFPESEEFVGEVEVMDIHLHPDYLREVQTPFHTIEEDEVRALFHPRKRFSHKGTYGHALLIAGKVGMAGASVLAAKACLRSGVGLLTVHVPIRNNDILQTSVPEAMVEHDLSDDCFTTVTDVEPYQAIGIGPGLGREMETAEALSEQLSITDRPMVIDADAINMLGINQSYMEFVPKQSILTPHPKELERLVGPCANTYERIAKAKELAAAHQLHIVLKGAWTAIIAPDGTVSLNPTGNPGMATGGSGDVLTGVLLALLTQGYETHEACLMGVYAHGLAGDLAAEAESQMGMTAMSIVNHLPEAWKRLNALND